MLPRAAPAARWRAAHCRPSAVPRYQRGAKALGIDAETGDFTPGKSADFVYLRAPEGSVLANALAHAESSDQMLSGLITMGGAESVREVRVRGEVVFA